MSMVPMTGLKFAPLPYLAENMPESFTSMGLTAENVVESMASTAQDQDQFSLLSHNAPLRQSKQAYSTRRSCRWSVNRRAGRNGAKRSRLSSSSGDEGPRADTTLEALGKLKAAFKEVGR